MNAFNNCTEDPKRATLYVSLEPCSHYGKTPPCADLIIQKDIDRVVTAMVDPNPLVAGKGIRKLRDAGIFVTVGVMEKEAKELNEVFLKYIQKHKPFVLYKAAMSLDGKQPAIPVNPSGFLPKIHARRFTFSAAAMQELWREPALYWPIIRF